MSPSQCYLSSCHLRRWVQSHSWSHPGNVEYDLGEAVVLNDGSSQIRSDSSLRLNDEQEKWWKMIAAFISLVFSISPLQEKKKRLKLSLLFDIHQVLLISLFTFYCQWEEGTKWAELNSNLVTIIELVEHWQACCFSNKVCGWKCCERL